MTFQGLRTAIYHAPDLGAAKEWYRKVLGIDPYFDEPFYVGFNVGGYELGLNPDSIPPGKPTPAGVMVYWGVESIESAVADLVKLGAVIHEPIQDVGGGIQVATVIDPFGNLLGVIHNPNFKLAE